jgi:hypothetical protein
VHRGEPPVVGITKLKGVTLEDLKRPRKNIAPEELLEAAKPSVDAAAGSSTTPAASP